jgi:predicted nucleotidyltransferase
MTPEQKRALFPDNLVLLGYRGSIAHNMYIPNTDPNSIDDIDLMGVYMAPVDHYIGLNKVRETHEKFIDQWDVVNYEYVKFIKLLLKSNQNVLYLLWIKDNHYIEKHDYGKLLIDNRHLFVSKKVYHAFTGYAYDQLKKMTHFVKEGYMGEKRKTLVEKYGYDCKNAAHCIRLLKMGMEFLIEGNLNVFREDASWLLEIKRGLWSLEDVKAEAKRLFALTDEAYIRSTLPSEPDYNKVNDLVKSVLVDYINGGAVYD